MAKDENLDIETVLANADDLPFEDTSFDGLLSYGVLRYLAPENLQVCVGEIHRVLHPGGRVLVVTRTIRDSRYTMARSRAGHTAIAPDGDDVPWKGEAGMSLTYLSEESVGNLFSEFSSVKLDHLAFAQKGGKYLSDDWLIFATQ